MGAPAQFGIDAIRLVTPLEDDAGFCLVLGFTFTIISCDFIGRFIFLL
ncbi:hypothetical protein HMPREF1870_01660 [Bacteroidales bacterium KA00344]|nr:hypothetical protein HMPREF1870_01660 [Bacteroidales bacterium KA00344]